MKEFLSEYNKNNYLKLCNILTKKLEIINSFILEVKETKKYAKIKELPNIYHEIFTEQEVSQHIILRTSKVINPYYLREFIPTDGNSSFFISLKFENEAINALDEIYNKQLTSLLRFYKNIFSALDNPEKSLNENTLIKYEKLIIDISGKMNDFLHSLENKKIINQREKIKATVIENLPYNGFYHMTHISNLVNILKEGLLSHKIVHENKLIKVDISNKDIQAQRNRQENLFNKNIHDYVPLYINPSNPMMNSAKVKNDLNNIALLEIIPHILVQEKGTLFSDGNAAFEKTNFYNDQKKLENINWELLQKGQWINGSESQRIMCSEVLIPEKIEIFYIQKIILKDEKKLSKIMKLFPNHKGISIELNSKYFNTNQLY